MNDYERIMKQRDNFIWAAIRAEDSEMKAIWLNRAEKKNKLLRMIMLSTPINHLIRK